MPKRNSGQVMPARIGATQGFGRFVTPAEVGVLFYPVTTIPDGTPAGKTFDQNQFKAIRAVLLIEMFCPAMGYAGMRENYGLQVLMDKDFEFKIPGIDQAIPFKFPKVAFTRVSVDAYTAPIGRMFMPVRGFHNQFIFDPGWGPGPDNVRRPWTTNPKTFPTVYPYPANVPESSFLTVYPFVSDAVMVPKATSTFGFTGGKFRIRTYPPDVIGEPYTEPDAPSSNNAVQTVSVDFPSQLLSGLRWPYPTTDPDFKNRLPRGSNGDRNQLDANNINSGYSWIKQGDIIRTMELNGPTKGDQRLAAALKDVPSDYFAPRGGLTTYMTPSKERVHGFRMGRGGNLYPGSDSNQDVADGKLVASANYRTSRPPKVPNDVNGVKMLSGEFGDWDRGISKNVDGAFINKPDEGTMNFDINRQGATDGLKLPYWLGYSGYEELRPIHFSPNRILPSAVMFGSLPRRIHDGAGPWETLLFRPASTAHPGAASPADHYLLDLFQMPVVEPYSISEPFSTAGKVNMNYMAAPFSYWKAGTGTKASDSYLIRRTGLHGILRSTKIMVLPNSFTSAGHEENPLGSNLPVRFRIDEERTLDEMHTRLTSNKGLFRSATEICEINLQATGYNVNPTFWSSNLLAGDNGRERPYSHIYPRLTTKSNVYTVHVRAQAVQKGKGSDPEKWDEKKDNVTGEYRGSTTLERFLDPNDHALHGYNELTKPESLDPYYRFRVVQTRQY